MFEGDGLESHSLPESFQKSQIAIPEEFETREDMVSLFKYAAIVLTSVTLKIYSQNTLFIQLILFSWFLNQFDFTFWKDFSHVLRPSKWEIIIYYIKL